MVSPAPPDAARYGVFRFSYPTSAGAVRRDRHARRDGARAPDPPESRRTGADVRRLRCPPIPLCLKDGPGRPRVTSHAVRHAVGMEPWPTRHRSRACARPTSERTPCLAARARIQRRTRTDKNKANNSAARARIQHDPRARIEKVSLISRTPHSHTTPRSPGGGRAIHSRLSPSVPAATVRPLSPLSTALPGICDLTGGSIRSPRPAPAPGRPPARRAPLTPR